MMTIKNKRWVTFNNLIDTTGMFLTRATGTLDEPSPMAPWSNQKPKKMAMGACNSKFYQFLLGFLNVSL
jgi:hypothetical protein